MAGRRYSQNREMIYRAVCSRCDHPTAEMVFAALKSENPSLSLGTVYRNLNLLVQEGALVQMPFPVERYDGEKQNHGHFCCESCGCVVDVEMSYDETLDAMAKAQLGCGVTRHTVVFYGICSHCTERGT